MNLTDNQNKFKLILLGSGIIVVILVVFSLFSIFTKSSPPKTTPTTTTTQSIDPDKFIPPVESRPQTPKNVESIKTQLIESAAQKGDLVIYQEDSFRIIYIPTPDLFLAQISKEPVEQARKNAQDFFLEKGLSLTEICNLPLRFALFDPALKTSNPSFNYFPDGCN